MDSRGATRKGGNAPSETSNRRERGGQSNNPNNSYVNQALYHSMDRERPRSNKKFKDDTHILELPKWSSGVNWNKRDSTNRSDKSASFIEQISHGGGSGVDEMPKIQSKKMTKTEL